MRKAQISTIFAILALFLTVPVARCAEKPYFQQDFESLRARNALLSKGAKIVSPGADSKRCVTRSEVGKYNTIVFETNATIRDNTVLTFDYRTVVRSGNVRYLGVYLFTPDRKQIIALVAPSPKWRTISLPLSKFHVDTNAKNKKPVQTGDKVTRMQFYGRGDDDGTTDQTIYVDNVTLAQGAPVSPAATVLNETPASSSEWGHRPADGSTIDVTPPGFTWRPQGLDRAYELQVALDAGFKNIAYHADNIDLPVHCPPETLASGAYYWRYRAKAGKVVTNWSKARHFQIAKDARAMPLPARKDVLARISQAHPRLFVRPEDLPKLRELAQGDLKDQYEKMVAQCDRLLANPPSTQEPPKYPNGMKRGGDPWRKIWWGNRTKTEKALNSAALLAFTRLLGGKDEYGQLARRILMDCAKWDPKGATGYRYNDEAGMPFAYFFSRTYTFVNDLLTEEEKAECRALMRIRGEEMYHHLYPRHLWSPYASHSNRAWHYLGEVGVAFHDEIPEADRWTWFALNVFFNCYPVWSDSDGGWHEGSSYWAGYQNRFTWWADVMRSSFGINAYNKPYYSSIGYYMLYLMPPGKVGGGFGDLTAARSASSNVGIVTTYATQAQNGYWEWWVEANGGPKPTGGYIGFVRGALPKVDPVAPTDLPSSRLFRGTGQAYLNTTIMNAADDVQVVFKSSPFGTQSHGYEACNSFLLHAWNKRVLIRSGKRDQYGSDHHKNWMWSTRSVNNITVNGEGQYRRSSLAASRIVDFTTTPEMDVVAGEAGHAYAKIVEKDSRGNPSKYEPILDRYTRTILFAKPDLIVVFDRLKAKEASTFEYWLHAINKFEVTDQHAIQANIDNVRCDIDILAPASLSFQQTDQYDPNPRPRVSLREWHLTGVTPGKRKDVAFVATYRVSKTDKAPEPIASTLQEIAGGYLLSAKLPDGQFTALLPTDDEATLSGAGLSTKGAVKARLVRGDKTTDIDCAQK